ncbi:MAG TPA: PQQ-dependent sugar dehydrogenase [Solirubrobacteraceae bacterium]|nr:PQQ-dependent sugar dehydrogenase [Solirubrobacteraceae bacterium]
MRAVARLGAVAAAGALALAAAAPAGASGAGVRLVKVGSFQSPVYVTSPPGDAHRLYVVEREGTIRVVQDGRVLATPFLDLRSKVVSGYVEQGLLGLAFAPDYARSGRFYVYYTAAGSGADTLASYRATSPQRADPSSGRTLISQPDPEVNHNGGMLAFGPDGLLYVGIGDGGGAGDRHGTHGNGQSLGTLLGKILRIDPAHRSAGRPYAIPASNPFVHRAGARGEIYAYGLRNPWRFSFDRSTGDLVIGDVGQDEVEEIDFARKGKARGVNYGWRVWEGRSRYSPHEQPRSAVVFPVLTKPHSAGWCSITGGYVVRDPGLPALRGRYVYGDYCLGRIYAARLSPGGASDDHALALGRVGQISSFGEDAAGRVYVVTLDGPVYRLAAG